MDVVRFVCRCVPRVSGMQVSSSKGSFIILAMIYAQLCYSTVAAVEALCFMDKFNILNILTAILAGCAIRVAKGLKGDFRLERSDSGNAVRYRGMQ